MEEITLGSLIFRCAAVAALLAANAFFVAAEFALVASRRTRIEEMVRQGDTRAKTVHAALKDLYRQLSAAQLGITVASILLGYVAEETVAAILHDWSSALPPAFDFLGRAAVASVIAVAVIAALHVVVGEQAPKAMAITFPESTSRWVAAPLIFFSWITRPVTNFLNWSSRHLVSMMGVKGLVEDLESIHSPEEIVMLVKATKESGQLEDHDVEMIEGVFEFTEKRAREVMTPRTEVVGLQADLRVEQVLETVAAVGRSRYPVYGKSLDDIVGTVHVKELLAAFRDTPDARVSSVMRDALFVPGTREVEDVLTDLKKLKMHIAVVLDEYGGTAGIVTMEDLIEEIVGEIYDEYDQVEPEAIPGGDSTVLPGDTDTADVNRRFGLTISDAEYQTIGGYVFGRIGRLPKPGDRVKIDGSILEVVTMDGKRVASVKLTPAPDSGQHLPD